MHIHRGTAFGRNDNPLVIPPFIISPITIINRAISVDTLPLSMTHVVNPIPNEFVHSRKMKSACSVARIVFPLTFVLDAPILQNIQSISFNGKRNTLCDKGKCCLTVEQNFPLDLFPFRNRPCRKNGKSVQVNETKVGPASVLVGFASSVDGDQPDNSSCPCMSIARCLPLYHQPIRPRTCRH